MELFDAGKLFILVSGLSQLGSGVRGIDKAVGIPSQNYQTLKNNITFVRDELERIGLEISLISAKKLCEIIHNEARLSTDEELTPEMKQLGLDWIIFPPLAAGRYQNYSIDLTSRFKDELSSKLVMMIPSDKASIFDGSKNLFSADVLNHFSSSLDDLDEASKCFSLGRNTACVFHLMRVMETATQRFGTKLRVPLTNDKTWQTILNEVNGAIKKLNPKDPLTKKYSSVSNLLASVKLAWRNEVMHPKASYDENEAHAILLAVSSFLNELVHVV